MPEERVQKILSAYGYGSRRDCENLIANGAIKINGKIARLGDKADISKDVIHIFGESIQRKKKEYTYIALNKPAQVLSNIKRRDNRKIVLDFVDHDEYLFIVGRLDYMSEGLILLTNDGDLANHLTHPRYEHEKEYDVLVKGKPSENQLACWRKGGELEKGFTTQSCEVSVISVENKNTWLKIILKEGKKRQIREVGRILGIQIIRIIRKRIATLELGNLSPGEWRYLQQNEITRLKNVIYKLL